MILRGKHDGISIDNSTEVEINALIKAYTQISPRQVMLYSIDRKTPEQNLEKVSIEELNEIAKRIKANGIDVIVS